MVKKCSFCGKEGHLLKTSTGEITCLELANTICYICRCSGHTPKHCVFSRDDKALASNDKALASNNKALASVQPGESWATRVKMNRSSKIITQIEKAEHLSKQREIDSTKIRKKEWENRQLRSKQKRAQLRAKHIEDMKELYGKRWYAYVFLTENDCEEAELLREKEDAEQDKFEEESMRIVKETVDEIKRNEARMTDAEFDKWLMADFEESVDDWENEHYAKESEFEMLASKEAKIYYEATGIMRSDKDFVKNGNGRLKPGLRERLQALKSEASRREK